MKLWKSAAVCMAAILMLSGAVAETISFTGTVKNADSVTVYAPIGGTVASVTAENGAPVTAGEPILELKTDKVYAPADGVVTGVFAQPGDSAEEVASRYGAVMYLEEQSVYSISASTDNAYSATENKFIHTGEEVFLSCYTDGSHTGTGVVTAVQGTDFTVRVTEGEFMIGETVNVFRGDEAVSAQRIGRGTLARISPTAVSGTGSIVSLAAADGDTVAKGDLLFETLSGTFDGYYMSGTVITAPVGGTVTSLTASEGAQIQKGAGVAVIWPEGTMRVEASLPETDLAYLKEGDTVRIELNWNMDEEVTYEGTVLWISSVAEEAAASGAGGIGETTSASAVTYAVWIGFTPDEDTRYGMTAVVTTIDPADTEETAEEELPEEEASAPADGQLPEGFNGQLPEGFNGQLPEGFNGQLPEGFDGQMPEGFDGQLPEGFDGQLPEGFDGSFPEGFDGQMPDAGGNGEE